MTKNQQSALGRKHNIESISFSPQEEFDERLCIHCGKCKEGCPTGARAIIGREMTTEEIMKIVLRDKPFYGKNGGLTVTAVEAGTAGSL